MAATEIDIPDFLSSKKDEREDYGLSSEILEEKIAEFSGNKVKQLEVAESVNTEQMETESETFSKHSQYPLSVLMKAQQKVARLSLQKIRKKESLQRLKKPNHFMIKVSRLLPLKKKQRRTNLLILKRTKESKKLREV